MTGFKRGELVLASKPYAYVLNNNVRGERCDFCFNRCSNLKRCTQCRFVFFCDEKCQIEAWKVHKMECKYIKKAQVLPSATMRLFALVMFIVKKHGVDSPYELINGQRVSFKTLPSYPEKVKTRESAPNSDMNIFILDLKSYIGLENIPPMDIFLDLYSKVMMHSTDIADDVEIMIVGRGLYLGNSSFKHSCDPDAEKVLCNLTLCYRAMKDLPHHEVFKVTTSYNEVIQLKKDRQADLQYRFFYNCQCTRCTSSEYEDFLTRMKTSSDNNQLAKCTEGLQRIRNMIKDSKTSTSMILDTCKEELLLQDQVLEDTHICKIKTLEIAFIHAFSLRDVKIAIKFGKRILDLYKFCYGPYSKTYAYLLLEVGKALVCDHKEAEARELFLKAKEIIKVTHGENHQYFICNFLNLY